MAAKYFRFISLFYLNIIMPHLFRHCYVMISCISIKKNLQLCFITLNIISNKATLKINSILTKSIKKKWNFSLFSLQQVDEKYVRTLHPYASNGRNSHRSKTHQQNNPSPYDKSDIKDPYSKESLGNKGNIFLWK
jgi:hypothetical protein